MTDSIPQAQDLESQASAHLNRGDFVQAEALYRAAIRVIDEQSGPGWAMRPQYNLGSALLQQAKHEEATPLLKELIASLFDRSGREETPHFIQQEVGALGLLARALEGEGKVEEAEQRRGEAKKLEQQMPI